MKTDHLSLLIYETSRDRSKLRPTIWRHDLEWTSVLNYLQFLVARKQRAYNCRKLWTIDHENLFLGQISNCHRLVRVNKGQFLLWKWNVPINFRPFRNSFFIMPHKIEIIFFQSQYKIKLQRETKSKNCKRWAIQKPITVKINNFWNYWLKNWENKWKFGR